jgi:hypothetical protein
MLPKSYSYSAHSRDASVTLMGRYCDAFDAAGFLPLWRSWLQAPETCVDAFHSDTGHCDTIGFMSLWHCSQFLDTVTQLTMSHYDTTNHEQKWHNWLLATETQCLAAQTCLAAFHCDTIVCMSLWHYCLHATVTLLLMSWHFDMANC